MRTKKQKIIRERLRIEKAQKEEIKVLYFAQDPQVSSRILAVLKVNTSKKSIPIYKDETVEENKKLIKKKIQTEQIKEIEKFQIICGSNGKIGTWYNTISGVNDKRAGIKISEVQKFSRLRVGKELTKENFLKLYPLQCETFKKIFAKEYNNIIKQ